jgi:hypothetical protein
MDALDSSFLNNPPERLHSEVVILTLSVVEGEGPLYSVFASFSTDRIPALIARVDSRLYQSHMSCTIRAQSDDHLANVPKQLRTRNHSHKLQALVNDGVERLGKAKA